MVKKQKQQTNTFAITAVILLAVIIVTQTLSIVYIVYKVNNIKHDLLQEISDTKVETNSLCEEKISQNEQDLNKKINDLTSNLTLTRTDLQKEVGSIKAKTSSDFSGIIDSATKSVVTIKTDVAQGTGFIVSKDGYVVTNAHVLKGAHVAKAYTSDKETKDLSLIGYSLTYDLALLKMNGTYSYLEVGDSDQLKVGQNVIAIGNPLGLSFSVSEGIISALDREGSNGLDVYIQTDAALNPGNSGGPLIDTNGKVIGINNFKTQGENLGFALESNYIKSTINDISNKNLNMTLIE